MSVNRPFDPRMQEQANSWLFSLSLETKKQILLL